MPLNHTYAHIHRSIKPRWKLRGLSWLCLPGSGGLPTVEVAIVCIVQAHLVARQGLADSSVLLWLATALVRAIRHISYLRNKNHYYICVLIKCSAVRLLPTKNQSLCFREALLTKVSSVLCPETKKKRKKKKENGLPNQTWLLQLLLQRLRFNTDFFYCGQCFFFFTTIFFILLQFTVRGICINC